MFYGTLLLQGRLRRFPPRLPDIPSAKIQLSSPLLPSSLLSVSTYLSIRLPSCPPLPSDVFWHLLYFGSVLSVGEPQRSSAKYLALFVIFMLVKAPTLTGCPPSQLGATTQLDSAWILRMCSTKMLLGMKGPLKDPAFEGELVVGVHAVPCKFGGRMGGVNSIKHIWWIL